MFSTSMTTIVDSAAGFLTGWPTGDVAVGATEESALLDVDVLSTLDDASSIFEGATFLAGSEGIFGIFLLLLFLTALRAL